MKKLFVIFLVLLFKSVCSLFDDQKCDQQLERFRRAIENPRENWAVEMFDYWAKIQSGLSVGHLQSFGHFDECIRFRYQPPGADQIRGQHCLMQIRATEYRNNSHKWNSRFDWREVGKLVRENSFTLRSGVCVPITCSVEKVAAFINDFLLDGADLEAFAGRCQNDESLPLTGLDIFAIFIFTFIAVLLALSTFYDIYSFKKNRASNKLLASFSLYTNGFELMNMNKTKSRSDINCMHGIRALSVLWIVLGHRRFLHLLFPLTNYNEMYNWLENIRTVIFQTDHLAVDTFLVMGGLLFAWSFISDLEKDRVSLWRMYLRRYLRYTPVLAIIIFYHLTLFKYTVQGPNFDLEGNTRNCENNWWGALLHIQNYLDWTQMCMGHSWYLSVDFQLFLVSPFLLYPAWKLGWKYAWSLPMITVATMIYVFIMAFLNEVPVFYLRQDADASEIFHRFIYFPTHARMGPWFLGLTLGYFLYTNRDSKANLSDSLYMVLWILGLSLIFAVVLGFYPFMQMNENNTTAFTNALYLATFRNAFALGVAWIIFGCYNGTGGFIRWFLSAPQWKPIGRLGLSIYLVHVVVQSTFIGNQKQTIHFDELSLVHAYIGDIVAVIILGAVLYLAIEIPIIKIEKYFSKRKSNSNE